MYGQQARWTERRTDGWMDEWEDGWMDKKISI